jgi:hypothetical protein
MHVGGNRYALEYRTCTTRGTDLPVVGAWHVLTSSNDLSSLTEQLALLSREHPAVEHRVRDRSTDTVVAAVSTSQ